MLLGAAWDTGLLVPVGFPYYMGTDKELWQVFPSLRAQAAEKRRRLHPASFLATTTNHAGVQLVIWRVTREAGGLARQAPGVCSSRRAGTGGLPVPLVVGQGCTVCRVAFTGQALLEEFTLLSPFVGYQSKHRS